MMKILDRRRLWVKGPQCHAPILMGNETLASVDLRKAENL
jgi:hypothetical protein